MSQENDQADRPGAVFWNVMYPAHIHLPANTAFPFSLEAAEAVLVVEDHHDPIVITDFANDFVPVPTEAGKAVYLANPVPHRPDDTIAVEFSAKGNSEPQYALWTKEHLFRSYRKKSYTEFTVGIECEGPSDARRENLGHFYDAMDRFIAIYRAITMDPAEGFMRDLDQSSPFVRRAYVPYPKMSAGTAADRMLEVLPRRYPEPILFSVHEFARSAFRLPVDRMDAAERIGHHLASGTNIAENQTALIECFAGMRRTKNYRFTVIDAFSVAEITMFDLIAYARTIDPKLETKWRKLMDRRGQVTAKEAINSFLPQIVGQHRLFPDLVGNLDRSRKLRHSAAHERADIQAKEAEFVLNTAQHLIFVDEEFRGLRPAT